MRKSGKLPQSVQRFLDWLWKTPQSDEGNATGSLRCLLRISTIFCREFQRDNIPLRASALTFTIVLSMVPTLALGTAVLKGLGAGDQMRQAAYRFIDQIDVQDIDEDVEPKSPIAESATEEQIQSPPESKTQDEHAEAATLISETTPREMLPEEVQKNDTAEPQQIEPGALPQQATEPLPGMTSDQKLTGHLRKAADQIFDYVDRTDFATLGAFGVVGLVIAVLSVLGSIEQSMNVIWQAPKGRPFGRKLMDYLALMILLPLSINLALATETMLQNQALLVMIQQVLPIAWLTHFLLKILPAILVMTSFIVLYRFLPNVQVKLVPALAGGAAGGISWLLIQGLYVKLQIGVAKYNAIYGSFATLPLFLLWLYIAWVVFLAGAEVAFACQEWRNYTWERSDQRPLARLSLAFCLLVAISGKHKEREVAVERDLVADCGSYSTAEVRETLEMLADGGFICRVQNQAGGYVPGAPVENLKPSEVIELIWGKESEADHPLAIDALHAATSNLKERSLLS